MSTELPREIRQSTGALMGAGVLAAIVGIIAIAVPAVASVSIAILIGILLLVVGIAWLMTTLQSGAGTGWKITGGILAALLIIGGIWTLTRPWEATMGLTAILAVIFIVVGVVRLVAALTHGRAEGAWLIGIGGALSILIGILIAAEFPDSAAWAIGLLVGIQFLFDGLGLIVTSLAIRRMAGRSGGPTTT